jgi:hypothetical protein
MKDGREFKKVCVDARGDPSRRLGTDEVMKKYQDCIDFAGIYLAKKAKEAAEMTLELDKVKDVKELTNILTYPDGRTA